MKTIALDIETVADQEGLVYGEFKYLYQRGKRTRRKRSFYKS